ncbi:MAG: hypothetical protein AAGJ81_13315 [Verrucomicrobiota bacterium]
MFLGGKEFYLAGERSSSEREVQFFYPYGSNERNWTERIEIHHYPEIQQPRRIVLEVLDRLRERYPDLTYRILREPQAEEAGISYLLTTRAETEVRMEFISYAEREGVTGLMAYRFTFRTVGADARYSRTLMRGKWDYYERAFEEADWPTSLETVGEVSMPSVFSMNEQSFGVPMAEKEVVESRSLTVRLPEGRVLRVDRTFLENEGIDSRVPLFTFAVPRDTSNLFIEYQSSGVPEVIKLSLASEGMQLAENLRIFPFLVPRSDGNERLWMTSGKLRRKIEEEYLNGWEDVRISEPFLTQIGKMEAFVGLASFADKEGNRMFARFTLFVPIAGDRGLLAFSQVDPRFSAVKRLEDLESGGIMTGVAHSIRFINPVVRIVEEPVAEPIDSLDRVMPVPTSRPVPPPPDYNPLPYEPIGKSGATN